MPKGVIYILTNPSFPDYVKIGYAKDIQRRLSQLNRAETIPFAFRAYAVYEVEKELTDKELHKLIDNLNPDLRSIETFNGKTRTKEFFAMSPEDAYGLLECIAKISGTEERLKRLAPTGNEISDEELANEVRESTRRGPFRFSMCNIPEGSQVESIDAPGEFATVIDDRHIEFNGVTTSLSALAQELGNYNHPVQGPLHFKYNGKVLADIRWEVEQADDKAK